MATKKKFTPEEIKNLKANPYTLRVTEDEKSFNRKHIQSPTYK